MGGVAASLQLVYLALAVGLVGFIGLFAFALLFNEATILVWMFAAGGLCFRHGLLLNRDRLAMQGTATARAASAALGLVELSGRGYAEHVRPSPVTDTPALFWEVEVHQRLRRGNHRAWRRIFSRSFAVGTLDVEDDTGRIPVWTHRAEIVHTTETWRSKDGMPPAGGLTLVAALGLEWPERSSRSPMTITEKRIPSGAPVYVIGTLAERRQIPARPTPWLARVLGRWASTSPRLDGQSWPDAFRFVAQGGKRWVARDLQTLVPEWSPPDMAGERVLVWKGDRGRPFVIAASGEDAARRALLRRMLLFIAAGAALMTGTLLVTFWKLTGVMR